MAEILSNRIILVLLSQPINCTDLGSGWRITYQIFIDSYIPHSTLLVLAPNKSESIEWNYAHIPQIV